MEYPARRGSHESARDSDPEDRVLDPQGKAIEGALKSFGIEGIDSVRQGKVFDIEIATQDKSRAEALLKEASEKLLANLVVENYKIEVIG